MKVAGDIAEHLLNPPGLDVAIAVADAVRAGSENGKPADPEPPPAPSQWWRTAEQTVTAPGCSTLTDVPLPDAILRKNTELRLFIQPPLPRQTTGSVHVSGPGQLQSDLFDGGSFVLVSNGVLGEPVKVDVRDSAGQSRLVISIPTRDQFAACE